MGPFQTPAGARISFAVLSIGTPVYVATCGELKGSGAISLLRGIEVFSLIPQHAPHNSFVRFPSPCGLVV